MKHIWKYAKQGTNDDICMDCGHSRIYLNTFVGGAQFGNCPAREYKPDTDVNYGYAELSLRVNKIERQIDLMAKNTLTLCDQLKRVFDIVEGLDKEKSDGPTHTINTIGQGSNTPNTPKQGGQTTWGVLPREVINPAYQSPEPSEENIKPYPRLNTCRVCDKIIPTGPDFCINYVYGH